MHKPERPTRPRALQACEVCRVRKNRCSEDRPCTYCVEHDLECTYSRTPRDKRLKFIQQVPTIHAHRDKRQRLVQQTTRAHHDVEAEGFVQAPNLGDTALHAQGIYAKTSSAKLDDGSLSMTAARGQTQGYSHDLDSIPIPIPSGQVPQRDPPSVGSFLDEPNLLTPQDSASSEVIDTNTHTRNLEFYGGSSSVAFLRHVETISNNQVAGPALGPPERSLASLLHNTEFRPNSTQSPPISEKNSQIDSSRFYFRTARRFLDAYFSNIHHIQPLFEEEQFLARCEDLWFDRPEQQQPSFVALYYATLSLGSLVMVWEDRGDTYGTDRFAWSRKLFNDALGIVIQLGSATDVEIAQCYYMLGKICQHELNPHVAYLYSGQAARTALAIGINRRPVDGKQFDPRASLSASMTWWAVYCLDIQTSFALGRPDSLGPDEYHTQNMPGAQRSDKNPSTSFSASRLLQITPFMVEVSKIMRRVGLKLYTAPCTIEERVCRTKALDIDLEFWLRSLPTHLQISDQSFPAEPSLKPRHSASHSLKQSVVLKLRYHNLRMVIHGSVFMTLSEPIDSTINKGIRDCRQSCIESACRAIDLIYNTFRTDNYFQTWWYNATYTLFAVSILLTAVFHKFSNTSEALDDLFSHIDRAIAVLQVMDECVVARNATSIIKRALCRAKKVTHSWFDAPNSPNAQQEAGMATSIWDATNVDRSDSNSCIVPSAVSRVETAPNNTADDELNWLNTFPFYDGQQALFWTEWAHELDILGT